MWVYEENRAQFLWCSQEYGIQCNTYSTSHQCNPRFVLQLNKKCFWKQSVLKCQIFFFLPGLLRHDRRWYLCCPRPSPRFPIMTSRCSSELEKCIKQETVRRHPSTASGYHWKWRSRAWSYPGPSTCHRTSDCQRWHPHTSFNRPFHHAVQHLHARFSIHHFHRARIRRQKCPFGYVPLSPRGQTQFQWRVRSWRIVHDGNDFHSHPWTRKRTR